MKITMGSESRCQRCDRLFRPLDAFFAARTLPGGKAENLTEPTRCSF